MLWVNLIMDSLASLSLATDTPTDDLLDLKPYRSALPLTVSLQCQHASRHHGAPDIDWPGCVGLLIVVSACYTAGDEPLISGQLWRNIIGQGVFQLALMYALVTHGDAIFGVPSHASVDGPSVHYTIVFNVFVLLQLFNQVRHLEADVEGLHNGGEGQIGSLQQVLVASRDVHHELCMHKSEEHGAKHGGDNNKLCSPGFR